MRHSEGIVTQDSRSHSVARIHILRWVACLSVRMPVHGAFTPFT
ncbi:hypothetical protein Pd630_LPD09129 (plasmid) [Rhodococcus opacus PD630]|nr:hypothetical protein Pd630_LPD09129 [Rhodococcus opacus PD630]